MAEGRHKYEHEMRVWEAEMLQKVNVFGVHLSAVSDLAGLTLKNIILAKSASAGAVIALLAAMWDSPSAAAIAGPAVYSVSIFAAGTLQQRHTKATGRIGSASMPQTGYHQRLVRQCTSFGRISKDI